MLARLDGGNQVIGRLQQGIKEAQSTGDWTQVEGDLQNVRDALIAATYRSQSLDPLRTHRYVDAIIRQTVVAYMRVINRIDRGIAADSPSDIGQGFQNLAGSQRDLERIHVLTGR